MNKIDWTKATTKMPVPGHPEYTLDVDTVIHDLGDSVLIDVSVVCFRRARASN